MQMFCLNFICLYYREGFTSDCQKSKYKGFNAIERTKGKSGGFKKCFVNIC